MRDIVWTDIRELGIQGKGWHDTELFYDRLPATAKGKVPQRVWELATHSAGMSVRFITSADTVFARWKLRHKELAMHHMASAGVSGLDLYLKEGNSWRWIGSGIPESFPDNETMLVKGLEDGPHELMLYLPLYNGVESVHLGVAGPAHLQSASDRLNQPMCFYGTSLTQGACASRPGMAWPSIVGRRLGRSVINLGFSGNGRMEIELAELLGELDTCVYVLDCLPNMSLEQIEERFFPFVTTLLTARPTTPIVLMENPNFPACTWDRQRRQEVTECNAAMRSIYEGLVDGEYHLLYHLSGSALFGEDGEATVDGVHVNDVGSLRIASAVESQLEVVLDKRPSYRRLTKHIHEEVRGD